MRARLPTHCTRYPPTSAPAPAGPTPRARGHAGACAAVLSTKSRKRLLPNREPPCSSGGDCLTSSSAWSRIPRIVRTAAFRSSSLTDEMVLSTTASERVKIHAWISSYVGDERNSSWSFLERILRVGTWKDSVEGSGGGGRAGVCGTGVWFDGGGRRRRGSSLGSACLKVGMFSAILLGPGGGVVSISWLS